MNRAIFGGLVLLSSSAILASGTGWSDAQTRPERGYARGHFALELEGKHCGMLQSATGGLATADVVVERPGTDAVARKHLGVLRYEEITIEVDLGAGSMCQGLYDWIRETLAFKRSARRSGGVVTLDLQYRELSSISFVNAFITEIAFPALDASSKELAHLSLKLSPEQATRRKGTGALLQTTASKNGRRWMRGVFRLRVDGLDQATSRVAEVEALTVKTKLITSAGASRDYTRAPASLEISNLSFTVTESHAGALYDWHTDFVVKGNNGNDRERSGTLEWLGPDSEVLGTVRFHGLGIFRLSPDEPEAGSDAIRRVRADVYVEKIELSLRRLDASPGQPPQPQPGPAKPPLPFLPPSR